MVKVRGNSVSDSERRDEAPASTRRALVAPSVAAPFQFWILVSVICSEVKRGRLLELSLSWGSKREINDAMVVGSLAWNVRLRHR